VIERNIKSASEFGTMSQYWGWLDASVLPEIAYRDNPLAGK
jgi:hypothetical protein